MTAACPFAAGAAAIRCEKLFEENPLTIQEELTIAFFNGDQSFAGALRQGTELRRWTPARREAYLREMAPIYRGFPKQDPRPNPRNTIGGRRLLDLVMSSMTDHAAKFQSEVDAGRAPADIYRDYLQKQREVFKINYGADEVFTIARVLQKELQSDALKMNGFPNEIFIGGSFVNGKASLTGSDIDVSVNNPPLLRAGESWQGQINEVLRRSRPEARLELEGHGQPPAFYGKLNPVVIAITAKQIRLLIFPPASAGTSGSSLNAGTPVTYILDI